MNEPAASPISVNDVRYVKELYPRLKPHDDAIERYRNALANLPPIVVARDGVLVDGYHRWQAHVREGMETVPAVNLGDLTDSEILTESIKRNATHGQQLTSNDKKRMADLLYRRGVRDLTAISALLSIRSSTAQEYVRDARRDEKQAQQTAAWDLWLDCQTQLAISEELDVPQATLSKWLSDFQSVGKWIEPPASRQDFDVWRFQMNDRDGGGQQSYFGSLAPQIMENLLWFFTEPGDVIVDLFAGSGTAVDVAKRMGRRVWAADIRGNHYSPHLPIHTHDATTGWPESAPRKADLVFLDPPYWKQAAGRYSNEPNELAEMDLEAFGDAWSSVVKASTDHAGRVAFIISPTQNEDGSVVDHATLMLAPFLDAGWRVERRIIVPYSTQQATGQQVTWARENKRMLKLYRDLVVLAP